MKKFTSELLTIIPSAFGLVCCLGANHAAAQTLYWDPGSCECTTGGGSGTWNAGDTNWYNGTLDAAWVPGDIAYIDSASAITLGAAETAGGLTFNTSGSTISGSTLTLNGASTINIPGGATTISSVLAGSSGLALSGSGTLSLSGVNPFTGGTAIGSGC